MSETPAAPDATAGPDEPPVRTPQAGAHPLGGPQQSGATGPQDGSPSSPPPGAIPGTRHESDVFFDRIREFGAVRLESGRWAAGVAGGLARRFDVDPLLVRGVFAVLALISGIGLVLYGLAWAFLPQEDGRMHAQELLRGRFTAGFVGAVIVFLIGIGSTDGPGVWGGPHLWFWPVPGALMLVAAGVFLAWWFGTGRHRTEGTWPRPEGGPGAPDWSRGPGAPGAAGWSGEPGAPGGSAPAPGWTGPNSAYSGPQDSPATEFTAGPPPLQPQAWQGTGYGTGYGTTTAVLPPPAPPRPREPDHEAPLHALTLATLGLALIAAAGVGGWNRWIDDVPGNAFVIAAAVALAVVAAGVVLAGLLGRRCGGLAPIGLLLAIAVIASGSVARVNDHVDRTTTWRVTSANVAEGYKLDVGRLVVDLTSPGLVAEATRNGPVAVTVEAGVGEIKIMVPDGVGVDVHSRVGLGSGPEGGELLSSHGRPSGDRRSQGSRSGAGIDTWVRVGTGVTRFQVDAKVGLGAISIIDENGEEVR